MVVMIQYFYFEKYLELNLYLKQLEMELMLTSEYFKTGHSIQQWWWWSKLYGVIKV